ncbi:MAG: hypothetical protein Q4A36_02555 [Candidatus Saccharibacteria bacterium]|nr:hypothetical protein [Candidatus Saccharibacteria bacterium]
MDNKAIYKKTIGFSLWRVLWDFLAAVAFFGMAAAGFVIADKATNYGLVGLGIGAILGAIASWLILHFIGYTYKAGQIAMMTKGVVEGKLPEDTIAEGKKVVKERFSTVAAYYFVTGAIKGIFNQIGVGITAIGEAIGGDTGGSIGSAISAVINTIIAYLCDCCLGWVFYKKDESATKATLEGAAIFFKHGKTLLKNLGRIFGISLISFIVIGGVFFGIAYLILQAFPDAMAALQSEITQLFTENGEAVPEIFQSVLAINLTCSAIVGIIFWSMLHSTFVRPFILVGVLRNFINSGKDEKISESDMAELDKKSKKFAKLHAKA